MMYGIVAVADNGVIGNGDQIPWRYPNDLRRFQAKTIGNIVVMGRKTYESIGGPLHKRTNVVLTRDTSYTPHPDVVVLHSREAVLEFIQFFSCLTWIIGGAEVYKTFGDDIVHWDITRIPECPDGDVQFPLELIYGFATTHTHHNNDGSMTMHLDRSRIS